MIMAGGSNPFMDIDFESDAVKGYLFSQLESLTDADPNADPIVLVSFIVKLLQKGEKSEGQLFDSCVYSLEDFLRDGTRDFVSKLFVFLKQQRQEQKQHNQHQQQDRMIQDQKAVISPLMEVENSLLSPSPLTSIAGGRGSYQSAPSEVLSFGPKGYNNQGNNQSRGDYRQSRRGGGNNYYNSHHSNNINGNYYNNNQNNNNVDNPRKKCKDYDEKGYCLKGNDCPYFHEDMGKFASSNNPSNSSSNFRNNGNGFRNNNNRPRLSQGPGGFSGRPTSLISARENALRTNRNLNRDNCTLVVEKIPSEHFTEAIIRGYFEKFGTIKSIVLSNPNPSNEDVVMNDGSSNAATVTSPTTPVTFSLNKAVLEYSSHEEADKAYQSPEVIFNNRFVKVYWHVPESALASSNIQRRGSSTSSPSSAKPNNNSPYARSTNARNGSSDQQAEEANPLKAVQEFKKKRQELLQKQLEQQNILKEKLANPNLSEEERAGLQSFLEKLNETIASLQPSASSPTTPVTSPGVRMRAPTTFSAWASPYAPVSSMSSFKVDNRPKSLLVSKLPDNLKQDLEHVKRMFSTFGLVDSVHVINVNGEDVVIVTYNARWEAEKALVNYSKLVDIGSKIQLSWYTLPLPESTSDNSRTLLNSNSASVIIDDDDESSYNGEDDDEDMEERSWKR